MKNLKTFMLILLISFISNQMIAQFKTTWEKPEQVSITKSKKLNVTTIRESGHIQVTNPNYDNIGQILTKIDFKYESYAPEKSPYMIFVNCGTYTAINPTDLRKYVDQGGVLYASDLSDKVLMAAFPGVFQFQGRVGQTGTVEATIEDDELNEVLGEKMSIHFDLGSWAILNSISNGKVLMRSNKTGKPLMVEISIGKGKVFYTCFHNHKQVSEKEEALLKLLIAKQVNTLIDEPFADTAENMGLDLQQMRLKFKGK